MAHQISLSSTLYFDAPLTGEMIRQAVGRVTKKLGTSFVDGVNPENPERQLVGQATRESKDHMIVVDSDNPQLGLLAETRYRRVTVMARHWDNTCTEVSGPQVVLESLMQFSRLLDEELANVS